MRKLRIAQLAPIAERVPPKKYGGTERIVHALTEELVRRGHEVTLFASGDSVTSARLESVYPVSLREAGQRDVYGTNEYTLLNIGNAYEQQDRFDIIHDHIAPLSLPAANIARVPVALTMHGPFNDNNRDIFRLLRRKGVVSISQSQARDFPELNHLGTVYNGLPMEHFPFSDSPEDYLLFVGRISMEKGPHNAVRVAQELGMRLIIAAKVDTVDQEYFRQYVEPHLNDDIVWIGEVSEQERNELMSKALCFLHPVTWREPFGLTMIEAMACGCPVVAFNLGSIPEIVRTGESGFVVTSPAEMAEAIRNIRSLSRSFCRQYALSRFGVTQMTDGYENMYERLVGD